MNFQNEIEKKKEQQQKKVKHFKTNTQPEEISVLMRRRPTMTKLKKE